MFGNDPEWIIEAIESCKDMIVEGGLQVFLVLYQSRALWPEHLERLEKFAHSTKGTVVHPK